MPFKKFLKIDLLALLVYVPLFLGLGKYFHRRIASIINGVEVVRNAILIGAGIILILIIFKIIKKHLLKMFERITSDHSL